MCVSLNRNFIKTLNLLDLNGIYDIYYRIVDNLHECAKIHLYY